MSITPNLYVTELNEIWDELKWHKKFEHSTPTNSIDYEYVFHAYSRNEVEKAKEILANLPEEETLDDGTYLTRSAHLGSWSSGAAIAICKHS